MADNFQVTEGSGTTIATDQVGDGSHFQKIKLFDPTADGTQGHGIATNPIRTDPTGTTTQPVSGPLTDTQLRAAPVPVSGTVTVSNFPASQLVAVDNVTGIVPIFKTATLITTAVTADQVIITYTVPAGKTFYMLYVQGDVRLTVISAIASILGTFSLEAPSGTKVYTVTNVNPTTSETEVNGFNIGTPIPVAAGTAIRMVCTPAAATSMTWIANFGGYEK